MTSHNFAFIKSISPLDSIFSGGGVRLIPVPDWNFSSRLNILLVATVKLGVRICSFKNPTLSSDQPEWDV